MTTIIEKYWWALMLRGALAIGFGGGALFCRSLGGLAILFGIFALAQGVLCALPGFPARSKGTFLARIEGMMGLLISLMALLGASLGALLWPSVTNVTLLIYIILWMVVTGVMALAMLVRLRGESASRRYLGLSAALCVILTILLVFRHGEGALGNVRILGVFGILYGVALILIGRDAQSR
jgi:uncharacterized membrane protein HdeD (DUF308 family)